MEEEGFSIYVYKYSKHSDGDPGFFLSPNSIPVLCRDIRKATD